MSEVVDKTATPIERVEPPEPGGEDPSTPKQNTSWGVWSQRLGPTRISAVYLWVFFLVLFGFLIPDTYLSTTTFQLVFGQGVVTCIIALAFLIPLTAGAYDLSVGALMSFALAISVYLQANTGLSPFLGAVIAIVACGLSGAVSGFLIVRLRINSFIATLGTSQILLAAVLLISSNQQLVGDFPTVWSDLGNAKVLGIPIVLFYLIAVALVMWFMLEQTRIGRYLFATGGNTEAARLSGVRTDRVIWGSMIASGIIAGLAGVIFSMKTGVFTSSTGPGYLFPAVAAVFLGASQLSQRPNVWGTLIAYFGLAFGVQGLTLSASSAASWSQPLFGGVALVIAVALASRPKLKAMRASRLTAAEAAKDGRS